MITGKKQATKNVIKWERAEVSKGFYGPDQKERAERRLARLIKEGYKARIVVAHARQNPKIVVGYDVVVNGYMPVQYTVKSKR